MMVVPVCFNGRGCSSGCVCTVSYQQRWRRRVSVFSRFSNTYCECNFSEIFKGRLIILKPCRNRKYPVKLRNCNWAWTHNDLVDKLTLNHLASLAKWLRVCLWTKWLWVRVQLQSLKLQISCLLRARSSLTFRKL